MLKLENIWFSVVENGVKKDILKNINIEIKDDEFVVITGPNGSGKSTLAKLIMGIDKPTGGKIIFDGIDITNMPIDERAKLGIGFAFQQPVKFKGMTVRDLIEISAGGKVDLATACDYLSNVGLCAKEYIDRPIDDKLSGGELKRIEIAVLDARQSKLSIFDEPEAGIDLWSFNNLIKVFKRIQERNVATMIISHQERLISIADKVILLSNGKVIKIDTPSNILADIRAEAKCNGISGRR